MPRRSLAVGTAAAQKIGWMPLKKGGTNFVTIAKKRARSFREKTARLFII